MTGVLIFASELAALRTMEERVNEWRSARRAFLDLTDTDARSNPAVRPALDRLASAEAALYNSKGT